MGIFALALLVIGTGAVWRFWPTSSAVQEIKTAAVAEAPITADFNPDPKMGGGVNPGPHRQILKR